MRLLHTVALVLVVVGALNWGLVGLLNLNLVMMLLGQWPMLEKLVYVLVGVSGIWLLVEHKRLCRYCGEKGMGM
ncbi:MAG TPA: DUF378 domain-containing protein [Candidatus Saccharimonadales bacterium]|nr:DUF378 domain-containing protein [Candidatus Saccharimonadales bacterium]